MGYIGCCFRHGETEGLGVGYNFTILRPINESVTFISRCAQCTCSKMVVGTSTCHCATCFRIGHSGNHIAVQAEVGYIGCGFRYRETESRCDGNFFAILCPIDKGITLVGCGRQSASLEMVVSPATSYCTTSLWIGSCCNPVAVETEMCDKRGCLCNSKAIGFCVRYSFSIFCPIDESVTLIGGCCQVNRGAVGIHSSTSSSASSFWVGRDGNLITIHLKIGHITGCFRDNEAERLRIRNFFAVFRPVDEGITGIGGDRQGTGRAVVISACSCDNTCICRVGYGCNLITIEAEMGYIGCSFRHGETEGLGVGYNFTILRPINESVTFISRCAQCTCSKMVVGTSTCHCATCFRIGHSGNHIAVQAEVGYIGCGFRYRETESRCDGNFFAILCPIDKGITLVGCGRQSASLEMVVSPATSYCTTSLWIGSCCNPVAVETEMCDKRGCLRDSEAIGFDVGHHFSILCPVDEGVALVGCGRQSASLEVVVGSSTGNRATLCWIGRSSNFVTIEAEVSHIGCRFRNCNAISRCSSDNFTILHPVDKGVTFISCGGQSGRGTIDIHSSTSNTTASFRISSNYNLITQDFKVGHITAAIGYGKAERFCI